MTLIPCLSVLIRDPNPFFAFGMLPRCVHHPSLCPLASSPLLPAPPLVRCSNRRPRAAASPSPTPDLSDTIARFAADNSSFNSFYSLRWSEKNIDRREDFLTAALDALKKTDLTNLYHPPLASTPSCSATTSVPTLPVSGSPASNWWR